MPVKLQKVLCLNVFLPGSFLSSPLIFRSKLQMFCIVLDGAYVEVTFDEM